MPLGTPKPKRISVTRSGEVLRGPLVSVDSVYAGSHRDITVRLDRQTLRPVWTVDSDGAAIGVLVGDDLLTVGGPKGAGVRRTSDGQLLWRHEARFQGARLWNGRLVIDNDVIEIREPLTGDLVRTISVPGGIHDSGTLCGSVLVQPVAAPCEKAINLESGQVEWERDLRKEMGAFLSEPSPNWFLAILCGLWAGRFLAMHGGSSFGCSLNDGSILWHVPVWSPPDSWPTVGGGRLYVLLRDRLVAIDEATGRTVYDVRHPELWDSYREKAGTVYRDRLAIATESGHLAVFNTVDGSLLTLYAGKVPLWRTVEADGRLLVATGDGALLVFDESIWRST